MGNSNFSQYTLYFHEAVVPLLEQIGHRLTHVTLEKFKFVDVALIGETCPKLKYLKMSRILSFCNVEVVSKSVYRQLEELYILNTKGCRVTPATVRQLLANSENLRILHLQFIASFTDKLCTDIIKENEMTLLNSVIFEQCHG